MTADTQHGPEARTHDLDQLAAGLHDGPLQVLYAAGLDLQLAEHQLVGGSDPAAAIGSARAHLQGAVDELRGLLRALRAGDVTSGFDAIRRTVGTTVSCSVDHDAADRLTGARGIEIVVAASTVAAHQRRRTGGAPLSIGLAFDGDDIVLELEGDGVGDDEVVADMCRRAHRLAGTLAATPDRLAMRVPA